MRYPEEWPEYLFSLAVLRIDWQDRAEREDSRKAKVDELCDRLELQMMGIKP